MSEQGDKLGGILLFRADEEKYTNTMKISNIYKHTNSSQLLKVKPKHLQCSAEEGTTIYQDK